MKAASDQTEGQIGLDRRDFLLAMGAALVATIPTAGWAVTQGNQAMYGLIGKMTAAPGQRDALSAILLEGVSGMPGCLSYIIAQDPADENGLWITEVWESQESHQGSLALPSVKEAIRLGRPLITGFSNRTETKPIGGHGLSPKR